MTCEVYESRRVKATRKNHTCEYCGRPIPIGSTALYEHGIFEHEAFGRYCCQTCEPFLYDFCNYMDGEVCDIAEDFRNWVSYFRIPHPILTYEIECPSCGSIRVMRDDWEDDGMADCPRCGVTLERRD